VELGAIHPITIETLATTFHGPDGKTLVGCEVLARGRTMFYPCTCGLCRDVVAVAAALIDYVEARLLPGRIWEGDDRDRLLILHNVGRLLQLFIIEIVLL
jgi:hypothetical protein